jgi:hypothetical protein
VNNGLSIHSSLTRRLCLLSSLDPGFEKPG